MKPYTLVGVDGNAFSIMGKVSIWMRKEGYSKEDIYKYLEDAKSGDYDHLLYVSMDMVDKLNEKRIMNKQEYNEYIKAIDVICLHCTRCEEEGCDECPVRKSVVYYRKKF